MQKSKGYIGIIEVREGLSGWLEALKLKSKQASVWGNYL
jgi:hypothetical protein